MVKKRMAAAAFALCALVLSVPALAGQWRQDQGGWMWIEEDGSHAVNTWKEIDGKWYYFWADGRMAQSQTVPDGSYVGADGAWVADATQSSALPDFNASISMENILAIADAYDKDGSLLMRDGVSRGYVLSDWVPSGKTNNVDALGFCAHEAFHAYAMQHGVNGGVTKGKSIDTGLGIAQTAIIKGDFLDRKTCFYVGDGQSILVPHTEIFSTDEWTSEFPDEVKTFRYNTYVSNNAGSSSNANGIYGLLNEFSAYCWGMNSQVKAFGYYQSQPFSLDIWQYYFNNCESDYLAYCEFRFYILGYLHYAKRYYPAIWQSLMDNQDFANVYSLMKKRFENVINEYNASKAKIIALGSAAGLQVSFDDGKFMVQNGRGSKSWLDAKDTLDQREFLLREIESEPLRNLEAELLSRSTM